MIKCFAKFSNWNRKTNNTQSNNERIWNEIKRYGEPTDAEIRTTVDGIL